MTSLRTVEMLLKAAEMLERALERSLRSSGETSPAPAVAVAVTVEVFVWVWVTVCVAVTVWVLT